MVDNQKDRHNIRCKTVQKAKAMRCNPAERIKDSMALFESHANCIATDAT